MKKILLAVSVLCVLASSSEAAVPKILSYQGVLKDGSGNFLTGTYSMTFRLYSASTGGSALWTETQSSVSAASGKFNVQLGSVTTISLDFDADYWLSIQVGADAEMTPRIRLTSSPYGIRADYENNGFSQSTHDVLSHKNVEGVKDSLAMNAKTNFKVDAINSASANSLGDLIIDALNDSSGINSGASSGYTYRGSPQYDVIAASGGIDAYAVLVLHGNGSDGSTTFTDSSTGAKTVTANGNAQIDTAQSKFSGASKLFDGTGDYLSIPDSADWDFGTGNFTIDFWLRFSSTSGTQCFYSNGQANGAVFDWAPSTGKLRVLLAGTVRLQVNWSPSTGTWYHLAVVRNSGTLAIYVDGTSLGSVSDSTNITGSSYSLWIGDEVSTGGDEVNGWLDEVRISKGIARWTNNFTPSSAEYSSSGASATVISNAYSEPVAPTEVMVIADATLNSGSITYSVSRDNGTTWTTCTNETITSISSQPSGTQVKWKAVITGDAELNAIAVAV